MWQKKLAGPIHKLQQKSTSQWLQKMQYLSYANIFKLICYYVYLVAHRCAKEN